MPTVSPVPATEPADGAAPRRYWLRWLPLLAVLALVTRAPSFLRPLWNPDEGFLATQARMLASGGTLYEDVVDRKPPLLPWAYRGVFAIFGDGSLYPVRAIAALAQLGTAVLLVVIARRRWGDRAGIHAGVLYLLASIGLAPEDTQAASFEVFMLPATAAAFLLAGRSRWGAAGVCAALATLTKQVGGVMLIPLVWMVWTERATPAGQRPRGNGARLAAGFLLPIVVAALLTGPGRFLFWTVTGSGSYASASGSWLLALGRALGNAGILAAACAGLLAPIIRLLARREAAGDADLWLWLAASVAGVVAGFHFFGHYYLQLLPPLVLLGVRALHEVPDWHRCAIGYTMLACVFFITWGVLHPDEQLTHSKEVAQAVRKRTSPHEKVLIWGMHPEDYWLADRPPVTRYLTAGLLTNFSGGRNNTKVAEADGVPGGWQEFRREMATEPPAVIVDDSRGAAYHPTSVPTLEKLLDEKYRQVDRVDGAVVYVRKDGPTPGQQPADAHPRY